MNSKLFIQRALLISLMSGISALAVFGYLFYRDVLQGEVVQAQESYVDKCTPHSVNIDEVGQTSFHVSWSTDAECSGYVMYGDYLDEVDNMALSEDSLLKVFNQNATVEGLDPSFTYYIYIVSGENVYGDDEGRPLSVMTSAF